MLDEDHFVAGNPRARKDEPIDVGLANARALALESEYFEQPSDSVMRKVRPGDFVKLCRRGERFWLKVTGYVGRKYHGQIGAHLKRSDLEFGDVIYFERKNIYDVLAD